MLYITKMLDFYNTDTLSQSILQVMQIQIRKKGKEKGPFTLLYKIVWFIFKSLFFGKVISSIVPVYENLKEHWIHSVVSANAPLTVFSQGGFYRTVKENLVYLFNTIEGKTKTNFYYSTVIFQNETEFKWNISEILTKPYLQNISYCIHIKKLHLDFSKNGH